ncbi:GNAT family N-acetyltransferase [Halobacillus campisalis]|uniref:GNAT family N-acetyltransferase n=1 Tax=Halobacillus campisalis TaxID=435909 RepID=A0ABW2K9L8_9BACI|nr:GNAT family protein [Halobacillus campisalis]
MFKHYIDEELSLKLVEPEDAEAIYQVMDESRSHLRSWLAWVDGTESIEHTKEFVQMVMNKFADGTGVSTCILYQGQVAGLVGIHAVDRKNSKTSIGYWLGERFIGKGIMTRATKAMVDYAIYEKGLNRVEIRAASENLKSRSIPERLGFIQEGNIRQAEWLYDQYVDHVVYGVTAGEWKTNGQNRGCPLEW